MVPETKTELVAVYAAGGAVLVLCLCATVLAGVGVLPVADWLALAEKAMVIVPALAGGYAGLRTTKKALDVRANGKAIAAHLGPTPKDASPR